MHHWSADWFILAMGRNSRHDCSPNATYDKLTGVEPTKCHWRDFVADMVEEPCPAANGATAGTVRPPDGPPLFGKRPFEERVQRPAIICLGEEFGAVLVSPGAVDDHFSMVLATVEIGVIAVQGFRDFIALGIR